MTRRLSLAFMFAALIHGQSVMFAAPALAVNCDLNACIRACQWRGPRFATGQACTSGCLQAMDRRKKAGQCK
jgi:hypothetical protein